MLGGHRRLRRHHAPEKAALSGQWRDLETPTPGRREPEALTKTRDQGGIGIGRHGPTV